MHLNKLQFGLAQVEDENAKHDFLLVRLTSSKNKETMEVNIPLEALLSYLKEKKLC